jgi:hypothetical protein
MGIGVSKRQVPHLHARVEEKQQPLRLVEAGAE